MGKSSGRGSAKPDWTPPLAAARLKADKKRAKEERRRAARQAEAGQGASADAAIIEGWEEQHGGHVSPEPASSRASSISRRSSVGSDEFPEFSWEDQGNAPSGGDGAEQVFYQTFQDVGVHQEQDDGGAQHSGPDLGQNSGPDPDDTGPDGYDLTDDLISHVQRGGGWDEQFLLYVVPDLDADAAAAGSDAITRVTRFCCPMKVPARVAPYSQC